MARLKRYWAEYRMPRKAVAIRLNPYVGRGRREEQNNLSAGGLILDGRDRRLQDL